MNPRRIVSTVGVLTAAVVLSAGVQVLAYTAPSATPTGGDVYAPLNTGPTGQTKLGGITVGGGTPAPVYGLRAFSGDVFLDMGNLIVKGGPLNTTGRVSTPTLCVGTVADGSRVCKSSWAEIGGVTSLTQGTGIILTPNPIVATGEVKIDDTYVLNTGATTQTKTGGLNIGGKVILGGAGAGASDVGLSVAGRVRIEGGSPATNAYLVAGGSGGDASWTPSRCGTAGTGVRCVRFPGGAMLAWGITATGTGDRTQSFPSGVSFTDTSYAITLTPNGSTSQNCVPSIKTKNTTSFVFRTDAACDSITYNWQATGF